MADKKRFIDYNTDKEIPEDILVHQAYIVERVELRFNRRWDPTTGKPSVEQEFWYWLRWTPRMV